MAAIRTRSKEYTDKKVEGFYQLIAGEECQKKIIDDLNTVGYIYPATVCIALCFIHLLTLSLQQTGPSTSTATNEKRAYFHPAIIASIRDCFFTGKRGTLADKHRGSFKSSINDGPSKHELELPIAMVAIVATTVSDYFDVRMSIYSSGLLLKDPCIA